MLQRLAIMYSPQQETDSQPVYTYLMPYLIQLFKIKASPAYVESRLVTDGALVGWTAFYFGII